MSDRAVVPYRDTPFRPFPTHLVVCGAVDVVFEKLKQVVCGLSAKV